jgi:AraC family transcriptional regulator of adaptative response/methylated-DNA-[protein]-cysteine methyltransferase
VPRITATAPADRRPVELHRKRRGVVPRARTHRSWDATPHPERTMPATLLMPADPAARPTTPHASASATTGITDAEAWASIAARDASADGRFVYGVRTTGVFCRPSCPSRRPRRENVRVFAHADDAIAGGFRACKRCTPTEAPRAPGSDAVARARAYLDAHLDERVPLATLAREAGMSAFHLQRTFTRLVGLSPRAYRDARRLERLKARLREGDTVSRATYEAGFESGSRVYARADQGLGMTPAAYRRGGRGVRIAWAVAPTAYGRLLVAATARGVCAVTLGDDDAALERWLADEFPAAERVRDDGAVAAWVAEVARVLDAGGGPDAARRAPYVPLDLAGTEFQLRVWRALQEIPLGATRTYGEVAASLGRPRAVRAVARACASNRVALVVPCHRVVRAEGGLGGYRWGVERKARLLAEERRAAPDGAQRATRA